MFSQKLFTLRFSTENNFAMINITQEVGRLLKESKIKKGLCVVFVPHATATIVINEDEEGIKEDILQRVLALAPASEKYKHDRIDNNARAHIINAILGSTKTILIEGSKLKLGTWQEIFFVELNGPRSERRVEVEIIGE